MCTPLQSTGGSAAHEFHASVRIHLDGERFARREAAQHRLQRTAAAPLATESVCQKWREKEVSLASPAAAAEPHR